MPDDYEERRYGVWVDNFTSQWLRKNCGNPAMRLVMGLTLEQAYGFVKRMRLLDGERFKVRDEHSGVWISVPVAEPGEVG